MRPLPVADLEHAVTSAGAHLAALSGRRLFLTGATGFVGSWLADVIAHANRTRDLRCEVAALIRPQELASASARSLGALDGVQVIAGDVLTLTADDVAARFEDVAFDAVVHAAIHVDASTVRRDPMPTLDTAVEGTRRVLELARSTRARRFLFVSSGAVYGTQPPGVERINEEFEGAPPPFRAESVYAEGKRIGETMCACFARAYGLETTVARCFAFVGPRLPLDRHFAIGNFMRDALAGRPIVVEGDGTTVRSYMHAADLTAWLIAILASGQPGRAYNVGSPDAITLGDLARRVATSAGTNVGVEVRGVPHAGAPVNRYVPCVARARDELGLSPGLSLAAAITRTLDWHRGVA